jgi:UDPglucose 6-dehydrogenase
VICTEWKNFRVVDFELLADKLRSKVIIDGRNLYNPEQVAAAGLHYSGIGLRHIAPDGLRS